MSASTNKLIPLFTALIAVTLIFFWGKNGYNAMVDMDESVKVAWSQVENQYQRRLDLIPNLVNTVKGYAAHEQETLEGVVNARARAGSVAMNSADLNQTTLQQFQDSQNQLSSALARLMVVVERYPELKASEQFRELQVQLEGTENRISVERKRFNETAQAYNTSIRRFPRNVLAAFFSFSERPYFAADTGAEHAPSVNFEAVP